MTTLTDDPFARPAPATSGQPDSNDLIKNGRYYIPDPDGGAKFRYFTRATTFAKTIADTYRLGLWKERMVGFGLLQSDDLMAQLALTSMDDRDKANRICEEAKERAGAKTRANLGTAVHEFSERIDRGGMTVEQVPKTWRPDLAAYVAAFAELGLEIVTDEEGDAMIERTVYEATYGIVGTLDRVVRATRDLDIRMPSGEVRTIKAGTVLIFDLKTGRDLEYGWGEITIQLAVYANAAKVFDKVTRTYSPFMECDRDVALVLHLPVGEGRATVYAVDIAEGWKAAWLVQQVRNWRRVKNLATPIVVAESSGEVTGSSARTRNPEWAERVAAAVTISQLRLIQIEAKRADAWTIELERLAFARRDAIYADTIGG